MAQRRMFSKHVIDTDDFLEMPASSQVLYFHLAMRADDDGFIASPKRIMRLIGAGQDDMKILMAKGYIIAFESGVCVIRHWRMHNYIKKDRYHETVYKEEKRELDIDENQAYTKCIQNVSIMEPQVRLELGKVRLVESREETDKTTEQERALLCAVIDKLNEVCGTSYKASSQNTQRHLLARIREGYTLDHFTKVILSKHKEWACDDKFSKYLRPQTLFGTKFESYLQSISVKTNSDVPKHADDDWMRTDCECGRRAVIGAKCECGRVNE